MKTKTSDDVLAGSVLHVFDAETLNGWVEGPLNAVLPHAGMLCGQSVVHSGGYAAIQKRSFGLPQAYQATIDVAGGNVRSPVLTRLMRTGGPEFFDVDDDSGSDIDAVWRGTFRLAGWHNLLGLSHREGEGDQLLFTWAAFYNVGRNAAVKSGALQQTVMPHLHAALSRVHQTASTVRAPSSSSPIRLTPGEHAVVALLLRGKTNKEIARVLDRSDETIKRRLSLLMKKLCVRNRTELVHCVLTHELEVRP